MTEENPYRTPEAEAVAIQPTELQVPPEILKKIRGGWVATLILGILNTVVGALAVSGVLDNQLFNEWMFIDAVLMFGLAAGIYFKSRTAATIMFFYYLGAKIFLIVMAGQFQGIRRGADRVDPGGARRQGRHHAAQLDHVVRGRRSPRMSAL